MLVLLKQGMNRDIEQQELKIENFKFIFKRPFKGPFSKDLQQVKETSYWSYVPSSYMKKIKFTSSKAINFGENDISYRAKRMFETLFSYEKSL